MPVPWIESGDAVANDMSATKGILSDEGIHALIPGGRPGVSKDHGELLNTITMSYLCNRAGGR